MELKWFTLTRHRELGYVFFPYIGFNWVPDFSGFVKEFWKCTVIPRLQNLNFFLFLDFGVLEKNFAWIKCKLCLGMRGMLLGYSFEPRSNSRALATAGSVMTIGLSTSCRCLRSKKKNLTRETRLTSPEDELQWPQKFDTVQVESPFSPPHRSTRRVSLKRGVGVGVGAGAYLF